jgi:predicted transposase/invertase (TIGR01784 family)
LSPTWSQAQQSNFRVVEKVTWGQGIYFLADPDRTAVVAIHQLPKTLDTLWLRLLGRGQVQANAVAELLALPIDHPYRQETLRHISVLQINLQVRQNKTKDLREVMMNLAPAYDKWLQETLAQGRGEGREEGREETQVAIALRLLRRNRPIEEVSQDTGLSIEVLQTLQSNDSAG